MEDEETKNQMALFMIEHDTMEFGALMATTLAYDEPGFQSTNYCSPPTENQARHHYRKGCDYRNKSKFKEAISSFEDALKIFQSGDELLKANISASLSDVHRHMGNYAEALKYCKICQHIYEEKESKLGQGSSCVLYGNIYCRLGRYEKAELCQKEALKNFSEIKDCDPKHKAVVHLNLAECYNFMKKPDKAIESCKMSLDFSREVNYQLGKAKSLLNLSNSFRQLRKFGKSITDCNKALEIFEKIENQPGIESCYGNLGIAFMTLGLPNPARNYYKKCIEINKAIDQHADKAIACSNLASCYILVAVQKGGKEIKPNLESSVQNLNEAIEATQELSLNLGSDIDKTSFNDRFYNWHVRLVHLYIWLARIEAAFLVLDLGRARALQILTEKRRSSTNESSDRKPEEHDRFRSETWNKIKSKDEKDRLMEIKEAIELDGENATVLTYSVENSVELKLWVLNRDSGVINTVWKPESGSTSASAGDAVYDELSSLFKIMNISLQCGYSFFRPCSPSHEDDSANDLSCHTEQSSDAICTDENPAKGSTKVTVNEESKPKLNFLYQALIAPVKQHIQGRKLIIVPDRHLYFVPFSSLLDENDHPLSKTYQIQMISSIHTLATSMKDRGTSHDLGHALFVGNPEVEEEILHDEETITFEDLPFAEQEVNEIAKLFEAKPLVKEHATKETVIQRMPEASIVHIAAHGLCVFSNGANGSYQIGDIALAPNSAGAEKSSSQGTKSFLLTQDDVLSCTLTARFVVLSCCHTARGKTSSEGVLGMARSFLGAGARSVLVALWSINDEATKEFMVCFYGKIHEGSTVCIALKETINDFQENRKYNSFQYWAPFVICGEDVKFSKEEIENIKKKSENFPPDTN